MKGTVIKSTGSWYHVRDANGRIHSCRLKGKFRLSGIKHTNPVTVGDKVEFDFEPESKTGVIHSIDDRRNYIIRKANNLSKKTHIIASNLDQFILIATLAYPKTSLGFIDRCLLTSEAYQIPAILVFNKCDLMTDGLDEILKETISMYEQIGYPCLKTSVVTGEGLTEFKNLLHQKTTLLSGHSGVGKSTLVNAIEPGLNLRTTQISNASLKGQHTTTFAEMHALGSDTFLIDTPGIREFGLVDFDPSEVSHYFKEMQPLIGSCRFNNCMHTNEPGCAIKDAVATGKIRKERYISYLSILSNDDIYE